MAVNISNRITDNYEPVQSNEIRFIGECKQAALSLSDLALDNLVTHRCLNAIQPNFMYP